MVNRDFPIMVATTLACLPIFWTKGVISRREGWLLVGLYVLYLAEQVLGETVGGAPADQYRFVVLVAVIPLVLVALAWQSLRWKEARHARVD
jgi:cation:H+ antiporter